MADIKRHRIKTIREKSTTDSRVFWNIKQFNEQGHTIYQRFWTQWTDQPSSGYNQFFTCIYLSDGKIAAVTTLSDSTRQQVVERFKYTYNRKGQLRRAGNHQLVYYSNGLLQSVENNVETERYYYNTQGQLTRIKFGFQLGVVTCGNNTEEWRGQYNTKGQLVGEEYIGMHGRSYQLSYDSAGLLVRRAADDQGWFRSTYESIYQYQNGLLARKSEKLDGGMTQITTYEYEQYR
ncbi:hypothetical protein F0P96_08690 [Hymenobacter busanensis]|uniref:Uncharacterized protein n=1 Tax=Hymenobacter busanensis TaxID=2607656 RepID=A0A7L4ZZA4_9BACT|nr:hypothetical protein [Hymenobacter busanensis]KAA9333052.1 hypothetical protein F0P96_08690 [Hymenobacter busanensis]QHJ08273.1 hypothetical protein GUY19_13635 [Hymenobacter busanensis]